MKFITNFFAFTLTSFTISSDLKYDEINSTCFITLLLLFVTSKLYGKIFIVYKYTPWKCHIQDFPGV